MDRRGMFGSRKESDEDDAFGSGGEAAEVRVSRAEARAELAERRVRDADEVASSRITAASQTLMEVREVVAMLHDQLETVTAELAGISSRFENAVEETPGPRPPDSPVESPDRTASTSQESLPQSQDGAADGANGGSGSPPGTERQTSAQPHGGASPLQRATRMAMAGKSRERIARALSEEFGVEDPTPILEEAMGHLED